MLHNVAWLRHKLQRVSFNLVILEGICDTFLHVQSTSKCVITFCPTLWFTIRLGVVLAIYSILVNVAHLLARRALGDFGVPIAIVVMVMIDYLVPSVYTEKLKVPEGLSPSSPNERGWLIVPAISQAWVPFAAIFPAMLVYILLFMETHICDWGGELFTSYLLELYLSHLGTSPAFFHHGTSRISSYLGTLLVSSHLGTSPAGRPSHSPVLSLHKLPPAFVFIESSQCDSSVSQNGVLFLK
uniref:Bicarbonate transporter-like transmembrane domain-containing protein n=1 Tax=Timema monikensis TaxID=170555 RepID=A0A7R9HRE9_9NEOP|nr:unnamed protein product [Timema monikensis]